MKQRILNMTQKQAIEWFEGIKRKFFSADEDRIIIEVPRGTEESFIVMLPFSGTEQRDAIAKELAANEFVEQSVRIVTDW